MVPSLEYEAAFMWSVTSSQNRHLEGSNATNMFKLLFS